jgi:hypothetical protein
MNWTYHLPEDERNGIEKKAPDQLASLARKGMWLFLFHHLNEDRKRRLLPPVRRSPAGHETEWEQKLDRAIEAVIKQIDARTGNYGSQGVAWVDGELARLKGIFLD